MANSPTVLQICSDIQGILAQMVQQKSSSSKKPPIQQEGKALGKLTRRDLPEFKTMCLTSRLALLNSGPKQLTLAETKNQKSPRKAF